MGRPASKTDLVTAAADSYEKMHAIIRDLTQEELSTPLDFSEDVKKERGSLETG